MQNIFVEFLPPWIETGLQPAFYDKESGTVLQQVARMYAKVNYLIKIFNDFSKDTTDFVNDFVDSTNTEINRFETEVDTRVTNFETEVDTRVTNFEQSTTETVNDYIARFVALKDFVDDYFDNLDVQEEINNKLDDMAEQGILQEIITTYIQSNVAWTFDNVAEMKLATNLTDDSFAQTFGFYNANDGGGALYRIRETGTNDTVDESTLIAITGTTLVAELVKTSTMDVLQFGCINDGSVDTSTRFNKAMSFCKNLTVSEGTYLLSGKFNPPQGMYMRGIGTVNLNLGGTAAQANLNSDVHLENLILKSVAGNLAWSRTDITDKNNIELINCTFQDFLDPDTTNAWGLEMRRCNNILIRGCHFENNTTSDIAMVAGCTNVTIDNCSGSNFRILVEPSGTPILQNIKISNCDIKRLRLLENQLTTNLIRNMSVENCTIEELGYDGADVCFISCKILSIVNVPEGGAIYGGSLKFVNSGNFSENLLKDPYLDTYIQTGAGNTTNEWYQEYTTGSGTPYTSITDDNGVQFVLNPDGVARVTGVGHQNITLTDTKSFILRINGKCVYPSGTTFVSNIASVKWFDNEDVQLDRQAISMFRSADGSSSEFAEQSVILTPPENATKMNITLSNGVNGTGGFTNSKKTVYIRSVELFKINPDDLNTATEIPVLPIRQHRIFYNDVKPTSQYGYYSVGDRMYYNTPSTYIGAVCTVAGKGGTWKDYGALAS